MNPLKTQAKSLVRSVPLHVDSAKWCRAGFVASMGLLAFVAAARGASGQVTPEQEAAAQSLYDDAWRLMRGGKHAEACPKLEESQRLDPGMGTLFQLASCYENTGRPASAWTSYVDIAGRDRDPKRAKEARKAADRLEAKLPRLTVRVQPDTASLAGLILKRDGIDLGQAQWGTAIPVDLGEHTVVAEAKGKEPWRAVVRIERLEQREEVIVPTLKDAPPPPALPEPSPADAVTPPKPAGAGVAPGTEVAGESPPSPRSEGSSRRTAAMVVGGVGLAGLAVGSVFGGLALSQWDTARKAAEDGGCTGPGFKGCNADAKSEQESASTFATVSNIGFIACGAAVAGAAILWLTAPQPGSDAEARLRVAPLIGAREAGISMEWRF